MGKKSKSSRNTNNNNNPSQQPHLVPVKYTAHLLVRDGDSVPDAAAASGGGMPTFETTVLEYSKAMLLRASLDPMTGNALVRNTMDIVWPRMLKELGPFRCNGAPECPEMAESFCSSPMAYLHLDPPFLYDAVSIPVCGKQTCQIRAKQTTDRILGHKLGDRRQRFCRNCDATEGSSMQQEFKACGKCKVIYYCSRECQVQDWSNHKKMCCPKA